MSRHLHADVGAKFYDADYIGTPSWIKNETSIPKHLMGITKKTHRVQVVVGSSN